MASGVPKTSFGMVAAAFGLFAGFASLVVILGGAVLTFRLRSRGLQPEGVVAVLPRELLISVGLSVVIQLALFFLVLLPGFVWEQLRIEVAIAGACAAAILLAYPFLRIAAGYDLVLLAAAWAVTAFILSAFIVWGRRKWVSTNQAIPIISLVIVGLAAFIPWRTVFEWRSGKGLDALVCLVGQGGLNKKEPFVGGFDGLYIGENDNNVYIGEKRRSEGAARIAEIPRNEVGVVLVGEKADQESCENQ
jgi:hypothetical protein